ncbi:MAG TPA: universal stress protein [Catenuloplanes sp.]|jgi:nucleotide-binding universal stress UspA family protein
MVSNGSIEPSPAAAAERSGTGGVVIGFDGSDSGEDALALGVRLAWATGERPVAAAVYPESPLGSGHVDTEWITALREHAEQTLLRARSLVGDSVAAEYRTIASGSAAHGLDDLAEALGASSVVVGSGRGGPLRRITAGSTAERLLHGASVPVVVAPRGHRERSTPGLAVVGCAFVDTVDGYEALAAAARLAARARARLHIYTVVAPTADFALLGGRDAQRAYVDSARESFQAALDRAVARVDGGVPATAALLEGDVVDALAALDDRDVDVLVVGSRGYGPLRRVLLGGTSSRLIRRAACPVMVVPRCAGAQRVRATPSPA